MNYRTSLKAWRRGWYGLLSLGLLWFAACSGEMERSRADAVGDASLAASTKACKPHASHYYPRLL